ncbi:MAG: NADH-quinone oxidoreductase subunit J, partial [Planctomycetota bacterium]
MVQLSALASRLPDWPLQSLPGDVLGTLATAGTTAAQTAAQSADAFRVGLSDGILTPMVIWVFAALAGLATVFVLPGRFSVTWRRVGGGLLFAAFLLLTIALLVGNGYANVYFWVFAIISILGSVRVITHPQPVYSALYFVLTVFSSAGLFVLCYAEFMAVALVTIYAGAILVTYTFVIMLAADAAPEETGPAGGEEAAKRFVAAHDANARSPFMACVTGFVTMGVLLFVVFDRAPSEESFEKRLSLTEAKFFNRATDDGYAGAMGEDVESVAAESGEATP